MSDREARRGSCGDCRYFQDFGGDGASECRRRAPRWRASGVRVGDIESVASEAGWPQTTAEEWCGEYRLDAGRPA